MPHWMRIAFRRQRIASKPPVTSFAMARTNISEALREAIVTRVEIVFEEKQQTDIWQLHT